MRAGHVLVIEGHHVTAAGEGDQVTSRAVVAGPGTRADLGSALLAGCCQNPEPDTEADRRLTGHPGELAAAHHPDNRPGARSGAAAASLIRHPP